MRLEGLERVRFDQNGLIPAVVQDATSKEILTLAYMNEESLRRSLETGETWFYSRSRQELWHKGETSGNIQRIVDVRLDCDGDSLLVQVTPSGPACHTGSYSCFSTSVKGNDVPVNGSRFAVVNLLEQIIAERDMERATGTYTTYLFEQGVDKILKKIGEEASEVIIAAKNSDADELKWEIADLLYHLLVLLRQQQIALDDVLRVLENRHTEKENIKKLSPE